MDRQTSVNDMLIEEISKVGSDLFPPGWKGNYRNARIVQESLGNLIDAVGEQSALAQGLSKPITSADKLRRALTHDLYLLKDVEANDGGKVIGFLKVARKRLYLFNESNVVCEVEPLCVLDFYVNEQYQRRGFGKKLFDHMLQDTGIRPEDLAVDGPSTKMEAFLAKHYGVGPLIRQNNNFAISSAFSVKPEPKATPAHAQAATSSTVFDTTLVGRSAVFDTTLVGRFAARKPPCSIGEVIHGSTSRACAETRNGPPRRTPEREPPLSPDFLAPDTPSPEVVVPASPRPEAVVSGTPSPEPEEQSTSTSEVNSPYVVSPVLQMTGFRRRRAAAAGRRESQLTEQGYFDIKNYHSKLW